MTEAVQIALIVAVPPTFLAASGIVIAYLNNKVATKKIDHVTVLTNSTLTAANKRIDLLEAQVRSLGAQPRV